MVFWYVSKMSKDSTAGDAVETRWEEETLKTSMSYPAGRDLRQFR
jgi:hypothetical protein